MRYAWWKKRVACAFVLAASSLVGVNACAGQDNDVQKEFQLGAEAMHDRNLDAAESHFRKVVQLSPGLSDGHLNLGLVLLRKGNLQDAALSIRRSLELNPTTPGANLFLGITQYQMGDLNPARSSVTRETELNAGNADAWMWLGVIELAAGAADKAVAPLDKAAVLDPKNLSILDYRARAHLLVSEDSYRQMYRLAPNSWQVHRVRAQLAARSERQKESISEYETALRLAPDEVDLYDELGGEYRKSGDLEQAERMYTKELQLSPHNAMATYNLGSIRVDRGNPATGVPLLEEAVQLNANNASALFYLGRGLAALGRDPLAAAYFERAAAAAADSDIAESSYYRLSQIYRKLQRPADAERALAKYKAVHQKLAKQSASDAENFNNMSTPTLSKDKRP